MNDINKKVVDKTSIAKDIAERKAIIEQFKSQRILDRENAIKKIRELRASNEMVLVTTTMNQQMRGSKPFLLCTDADLVAELQMQKDILELELLKKTGEDLSHTNA